MTEVATGRAMIPKLSALARFTFVDVILWALRIGVVVVVVAGTIGTLLKGRYGIAQWFDLLVFGLTIGSVYALIALGYTMVYGVLRLINFAHGDIMMTGAFSGFFIASSLYEFRRSRQPSGARDGGDPGGRRRSPRRSSRS